jgi:predicted DCC family thiol-disulfide oxidoreductase YuxK
MKRVLECWKQFWFEPSESTNVSLCRLLFFGIFVTHYLGRDTSAWADVPDIFWMPIPLFKFLHLPVLSSNLLAILDYTWKGALTLSCFGLLTRPSTVISFILGVYLLGLPQNFGKTHHVETLVVLIMGIMAFSRCGDGWSIDRLIRLWRRQDSTQQMRATLSGEYTWPIRLIWALFVLVFFGAGISKIRHSGLEWVLSDNMKYLLIRHHYSHEPLTSWGLYLAEYSWLCQLLAAATLVLEIGSPLALFSHRLRSLIVPGLFFMQVGIWILMGVLFLEYLFCFLFWIPWNRLLRWLPMPVEGKRKYFVLYDGSCGLCQTTIAMIRGLDLMHRVKYYDVFSDWSEIRRQFPKLKQTSCLDEMHVISAEGRIAIGFNAYRSLAQVLPLGWLALPFLFMPGVSLIGRIAYAAMASRHRRVSCSLPPSQVIEVDKDKFFLHHLHRRGETTRIL